MILSSDCRLRVTQFLHNNRIFITTTQPTQGPPVSPTFLQLLDVAVHDRTLAGTGSFVDFP